MKRILLLSGLGAVAMAAAWAIGFGAAVVLSPEISAPPDDIEPPANFALYGEVWRHVDSEFYGARPEAVEISRGAVEGVVEAIDDPWSIVVAADQSSAVGPQLAAGIGAWVEPVSDGARVLAVLPDSLAEREGLQPNDLVVNAEKLGADAGAEGDPLAVEALEPLELVKLMTLLPAAHSVVVVREGEAAFAVEFEPGAPTELEPVSARELQSGVIYVQVGAVTGEAAEALEALLPTLGLEEGTSLVLDLRDNPGGDAAALEAVAAWFLDGELYATTTDVAADPAADGGRDAATEAEAEAEAEAPGGESVEDEPAAAQDGGDAPEIGQVRAVDGRGALQPSVVLINRGTGGTAEILAAGLARRGARLVGEASFGRDGLQEGLPLADGTIIRMTTLRWTSPDGEGPPVGGLAPDTEVRGRQAQLEAAIELALAAGSAAGSSASRDR